MFSFRSTHRSSSSAAALAARQPTPARGAGSGRPAPSPARPARATRWLSPTPGAPTRRGARGRRAADGAPSLPAEKAVCKRPQAYANRVTDGIHLGSSQSSSIDHRHGGVGDGAAVQAKLDEQFHLNLVPAGAQAEAAQPAHAREPEAALAVLDPGADKPGRDTASHGVGEVP